VRPHRSLGTTAGGHRWVWDLRAARPLATSYSYPISAVPLDTVRTPLGVAVLAGSYTVKLTVNGKTLSAPLEVRLDPRIKLAPAALAQQHQLALRLSELVTRSSQLVLHAQSTVDQLTRLADKPPAAMKDPIEATLAKITAVLSGPKGPPPGPGRDRPPSLTSVNGKLVTLYRMVDVDAAPTAVQGAETAKAERELVQLAAAWDAVRTGELAALNTALTAAGRPAIRPELAPQTQQDEGDEE
jgi:hypothetical protein